MIIRCAIIDDEPLSREVVQKYLDELPGFELTGICCDAFEASDLLRNSDIDLVFLDINMPKLSGLQFIKSLNNPPLVIFTTAYPEYALEGFEVDAVDYLLKPFSMERFLRAVNKAADKLLFNTGNKYKPERSVWLKADRKLHQVVIGTILFVESCGDYVKVVTTEGNIVVHETMQNMLDLLNDKRFMRVHKSYIISLTKIEYVEGNRIKIGEVEIPVGQVFRDEFQQRLRED